MPPRGFEPAAAGRFRRSPCPAGTPRRAGCPVLRRCRVGCRGGCVVPAPQSPSQCSAARGSKASRAAATTRAPLLRIGACRRSARPAASRISPASGCPRRHNDRAGPRQPSRRGSSPTTPRSGTASPQHPARESGASPRGPGSRPVGPALHRVHPAFGTVPPTSRGSASRGAFPACGRDPGGRALRRRRLARSRPAVARVAPPMADRPRDRPASRGPHHTCRDLVRPPHAKAPGGAVRAACCGRLSRRPPQGPALAVDGRRAIARAQSSTQRGLSPPARQAGVLNDPAALLLRRRTRRRPAEAARRQRPAWPPPARLRSRSRHG